MSRVSAGGMVVSLCVLAACSGDGGGGAPTAMSAPAPAAATAAAPVAADDLLDWAERTYPDLFPQGSVNRSLAYQGSDWTVRSYDGSWGTRHLGVDANGGVAGLGDFTNQALQRFGTLADYAAQVTPGNCTDYPLADGCATRPAQRRLAVGQDRVLAVNAQGRVLVWGDGPSGLPGALGGTPVPDSRALDTGLVARSVATQGARLMAVTASGAVMAWGHLYDGELGDPYDARQPRQTQHVVPLPQPMLQPTRVAQAEDGAVLRQDGSVWISPGRRVDVGGGLEQIVPVKLTGLPPGRSLMRGSLTDPAGPDFLAVEAIDGALWMGRYGRYDDLSPQARPLSPVRVDGVPPLAQLDCGLPRTCALLGRDGTVWLYEMLVAHPPFQVGGLTDIVQVAFSRSGSLALGRDGRVWSWSYTQNDAGGGQVTYSTTASLLAGLDDVAEIAVGGYDRATWVARRRDGSVWGWGDNSRGQLGGGSLLTSQPTPVRIPGIKLN